MNTPARVVVVGGNFGRVHARAVLAHPDRYRLAGVAGRAGVVSRELAALHEVPYFSTEHPEEIAEAADIACVAVGSAISGGEGTELALQLLGRGVHVVQEHPLHPEEMLACARAARAAGVQHRVNLHYRHVKPVKAFVEAARRLAVASEPLFLDAAAPVHVLHPLIDVFAAALGGVRPWAWHHVVGEGPLRTVTGTFAGVPVTLRVQNELDPLDRDNHALFWHRVALGTAAGTLTLADTHGPVLWSPRWHADRDEHHRLILDGPAAGRLAVPSTEVLPGTEPVTMSRIIGQWWPQAVAATLDSLVRDAEAGTDPLRRAQLDLSTTRIWADLTTRLGSPGPVRREIPRPVTVDDLMPPPVAGPEPTAKSGYSLEAEFYDLVAAQRTGAVDKVVQALSAVRAEHGPVVEIGAGTGLLATAIARARPDLNLIAAEPDPVMRAVLTSKVVRDPDLRGRVTVTAGSAPDLDLPERIGAALVCGVAGHLSPSARKSLWHRLGQRIFPGGPLVVEMLAVEPGTSFAPVRLGRAQIGADDVTWWLAAEADPAEPTAGTRLTSQWQVARQDVVQRSSTAHHTWYPLSLADVAAESGFPLEVLVAGGTEGAAPLGVLRAIP